MDERKLKDVFENTAVEEQARKEELVRRVVGIVARGNVNLRLGRYVTQRDVDEMRASVLAYTIKAPI